MLDIYNTDITVFVYSPVPSPPYSTHSPLQHLPSVTEDDTKEHEEDGEEIGKELKIKLNLFQISPPPPL